MKTYLISLSLLLTICGVSQADVTSGAACSSESISLSNTNPAAEKVSLCYSRHIRANNGAEIFENLVLANSSKTLVIPIGHENRPMRSFNIGQVNALCSKLVPGKRMNGSVLRSSTTLPSQLNQTVIKYFATIGTDHVGAFTGFVFGTYDKTQIIVEDFQCY